MAEKPSTFSIHALSHAGKRPAAEDNVESSAIFFDLLTVVKRGVRLLNAVERYLKSSDGTGWIG